MHSCPECGAETPLVSGLEPSTLRFNAKAAHTGTTATLNSGEIDTSQLISQPLPPPVVETMGSRFVQPDAESPKIPADTQGSRTALVVAVSVIATVCLLALGFIVVRAWLKDSKGKESPDTESAALPSATPTATMRPASPPSRIENIKVDTSAIEREVTATLNGWAAASQAHDLDTHMSYYADILDTYYLRSNVSADFVRADRARAYSRFTKLDIKLSNIEVTPDPSGTRATAVFDKTYNFEGDKYLSGSVRQAIWLKKIGGRWLITGEKDLQVYYVNH